MASIWIDAERKIVKADENWDQLAGGNNARELQASSIIGKYITSFIKGDQVRMFIDAIITRVNVSGKPYLIHYRCDGPHKAQFMRMLVKKENDNLFLIEHDLIKSEPINPSILFTENQDATQKRCAICGKVQFKDEWYDALINRKIFGTVESLETSSSLCPSCEKQHRFV
ncbi:hypothetical protein [Fulvivirga ligni]|uniref:hypothetical protein n=1 Tax=Fulvivirga ligni TaxID=2904246 RepID=UPI001F1B6112|nr:hypothetical protein [Fulvivirga ligni]UII19735.1 hypothetical protein LVD16_17985 [Fulvivirga ligni]